MNASLSQVSQGIAAAAMLLLLIPDLANGNEVRVRDGDQLRRAMREVKPGTHVLLESGNYEGGFYFKDIRGESEKPVVVAAADPQQPPVFTGKGVHFSAPAYLELRDLAFRDIEGNGLNIDDGGKDALGKAEHIKLIGIKLSNVGPKGNRDGFKLSGISHFEIRGCALERWGTAGSGIDMVGCHKGVLEGNIFRDSRAEQGNGVQCKGGTSDITIRRNRFENAGSRAINLGGSTGLQYFRPPLEEKGAYAEARNLLVEGNEFIGSPAPIAYVGVDGAIVRFNTFYRPERWVIRILQENKAPGFIAARNGVFSDNLVVFDSGHWSEGGLNVGGGTAPDTFKFSRNWWYCVDQPARSRPRLPVEEDGGTYGTDPLLHAPEEGDLKPREGSPASKVGAHALPKG